MCKRFSLKNCALLIYPKNKKTKKYIKRPCESSETWLADYKRLVKSHRDLFARCTRVQYRFKLFLF